MSFGRRTRRKNSPRPASTPRLKPFRPRPAATVFLTTENTEEAEEALRRRREGTTAAGGEIEFHFFSSQ